MSKQDKIYFLIFTIAAVMLTGIVAENIRLTLIKQAPDIKIDVAKVKEDLQKAGVSWREAKYWKKL